MDETNSPQTSGRTVPDGLAQADVGFIRQLVHRASVPAYSLDTAGCVTFWNRAAERLFSWSEAEVQGHPDPTLMSGATPAASDPASDSGRDALFNEVLTPRQTKDGAQVNSMSWIVPQMNSSGDPIGTIVFTTDQFKNTALYRDLEHAQSTIERVVSNADISIWSHDLVRNVSTFGSSAGERIYGYSHEEFAADPLLWRKVIHPDDVAYLDSVSLFQTLPIKAEYRIIRKDGAIRWVENILYPQFDAKDTPVFLEGITLDITVRREAEEKLRKLAYTDMLTRLPNRYQFEDDIARRMVESTANGQKSAVLYVDFDGFKYINDTFGHHFGDAVLKRISDLLQSCASTDARVYRMGGDEFTVVLMGGVDAPAVSSFADRVLAQFSSAMHIGDEDLHIHCSIGAAIYPDHGDTADTLLRHADVAMYTAKEHGGHRYCLYSPQLPGDYRENLRLHSALTAALRDEQFELYYQPKLNTPSASLSGIEALIRWRTTDLGIIGPGAFIPFAEQSGLIWDIGTWVLETACRQNRQWQDGGLPPVRMSVNVSMVQLEHPDFVGLLQDILQRTGLQPKWLELEITESVLVKSLEHVSRIIDEITLQGVHVSVDDFGTGYSSLQYLAHLSVGTLKIDRSFISNLESSENAAQLVQSIVQMAHTLNMRVVAEGVERREQIHILKEQHCDEIQGFLILQPQPKQTFERYYRGLFEVPLSG